MGASVSFDHPFDPVRGPGETNCRKKRRTEVLGLRTRGWPSNNVYVFESGVGPGDLVCDEKIVLAIY